MQKITIVLLLALFFAPLLVQAETPTRQPLFHIARSKNANIVQYDAQVDADGKLFRKAPVVAYWIRLAEEGQVQKLSWIQKTFAYGFDAKLNGSREEAELDMKADVKREVTVVRVGDKYRATIRIDDAPSYFDKMYIDATLNGWSLSVHYVELYGEDIKTGEARYEKFVP
ncbi:DUF4833 domain-containing protein [Pseudomonadota bacterium]|jgi:hypothetical protein